MQTNRVVGGEWSYDANGNALTRTGGFVGEYDVDDVENRLRRAGGSGGEECYGYDGGNRRIYVSKLATNGTGAIQQEILTWWSGGKRASRYEMIWTGSGTAMTLKFRVLDTNVWFGGKPLKLGSETNVVADRLGTIRRGPAGKDYFPYGMENAASQTTGDKEKYATYLQDGRTDLAYADQRYYAPGAGRFMTADPAGDGLNWYGYVGGDPVNRVDPRGEYPLFTLLGDRYEASTIRYIYQAFILLHELGHVFNLRSSTGGLLYGGSSIQDGDGDPSQSSQTIQSQNNALVFNNCIAPFFGLSTR